MNPIKFWDETQEGISSPLRSIHLSPAFPLPCSLLDENTSIQQQVSSDRSSILNKSMKPEVQGTTQNYPVWQFGCSTSVSYQFRSQDQSYKVYPEPFCSTDLVVKFYKWWLIEDYWTTLAQIRKNPYVEYFQTSANHLYIIDQFLNCGWKFDKCFVNVRKWMGAERAHLRRFGVIFTHPCIADSFRTMRIGIMWFFCCCLCAVSVCFCKYLYLQTVCFSKSFLINESNVQSNSRSFLKKKTSLENIQHNIWDTRAELQRWKWNVFGFKHSHVAVLQFQNQSNVSP